MGLRKFVTRTIPILAILASGCGAPTTSIESSVAPLVLVSFDGFRWDYAQLTDTPNLDRLAARGVRAEALIPPYPSKTFPSHYTLVTGLYPGHHGIISNNMRDPRWPEVFGLGRREEVQNPRWWGGEPIWLTAQRQGLRAGVYFWPGSEAPIAGSYPNYWFPYDGAVPYEERVSQALAWLDQRDSEAVRLVALYFDEPNGAGHDSGPRAPETMAAVRRVDAALGLLLDGLEERGRLNDTNVVVVSDHGMAQNDPSRVIVLEDLVKLHRGEVLDLGAILQLYPEPGREDEIYAALHGANPHLRIYRRTEIPEHLHLFDNRRLPPILGIPDAGWEVLSQRQLALSNGKVIAGDHGQDPRQPDMQAIFYAAGPAFAESVVVPAFESVDVYDLLCAALGIEPAPNDGEQGRTEGVLRGH